jgi:membrane-bound inhibitor of C-type lysozyme
VATSEDSRVLPRTVIVHELPRAVLGTALAIALLAAAGCERRSEPAAAAPAAPVAADPLAPRTQEWECEGGAVVTTRTLPHDDALSIKLHEGERKLAHVPSGSGSKYHDGPITFWVKGATAYYEHAPAPPVSCREKTG